MYADMRNRKINTPSFFTTGDPSFEIKTQLFLPLTNVRVSVQIFIIGLAILVIFGQTLAKFELSTLTANKTFLNLSCPCAHTRHMRPQDRRGITSKSAGIHQSTFTRSQYLLF